MAQPEPWKAHVQRFRKSGRSDETEEGDTWGYRVRKDAMRTVHNPTFERYYRELHPIAGGTQAEWESFVKTMATPLPTTLWINDLDPMAAQVKEFLSGLDPSVAQPIPWYPIEGMAWRISVDKAKFRRDPEFQTLRRFLITQTACGTISRQEEVSMIPVFLLGIQRTDKCLDMCASPGSKTAQMLVALGRGKRQVGPNLPPFDYGGEGCVVGNELDPKRANMLVYQVKRLRSLFPFALFTNHDARFFHAPRMEDGSEFEFDKVLCDVVCSGDGTLRKAPHLLGQWKPSIALNLQPLQVQIALRGCHLLRQGGRMVYSTCSLNPIENEAVVGQILLRTNGSMRLVDARSLLPNLRCDTGMQTWAVVNAQGELCPNAESSGLHPGLFPAAEFTADDAAKCLRFMPKHCEGGGFFVAVLEKVGPFKLSQKEVSELEEAEQKRQREKRRQARLRASKKADRDESAMKPEEDEEETRRGAPKYYPAPEGIEQCWKEYYKADNLPMSQLVVRCDTDAELPKTTDDVPNALLYFASSTVRDLVLRKDPRCTIVSAGIRAFKFEKMTPLWRITAEACSILAPLLVESKSPRVFNVHLEDVTPMLAAGPLKDVLLTQVQNAEFRDALEKSPIGPIMLRVDGRWGEVCCPAFRARTRVQLFIENEDVIGLKNRLGIAATADEVAAAEGSTGVE